MSQVPSNAHPSLTARKTRKIRRVSDDVVLERSGPDAQGMVESGEFVFVPRSVPSARETLEGMGVPALRDLLGGALHKAEPRSWLIAEALRRVEAGELELP